MDEELPPKQLIWVARSEKELSKFPEDVIDEIIFILELVRRSKYHSQIKPLKGFNGVFEIVSNYKTDTYRTVYAIKIDDFIYVLHAFKKKSTKGIKTPKQTIDLIKKCLQTAREVSKKLNEENQEDRNNE